MSRASSEIQEAFRLFRSLAAPIASAPVPREVPELRPAPPVAWPAPAPPATAAPAPSPPVVEVPPPSPELTAGTRAERLDRVLDALRRRAGLAAAVVADDSGFPLAVQGTSVENLAAFTSVLGEALEKAGRLLGRYAADTISMDVDYEHELVLKRFRIERHTCYLMVLGPQHVDQRSELEVTIGQLVTILSGR
jgi:hypothetical protein